MLRMIYGWTPRYIGATTQSHRDLAAVTQKQSRRESSLQEEGDSTSGVGVGDE